MMYIVFIIDHIHHLMSESKNQTSMTGGCMFMNLLKWLKTTFKHFFSSTLIIFKVICINNINSMSLIIIKVKDLTLIFDISIFS